MRATRRARLVAISVATLVLLQAIPVWAWGPLGHRLAGKLAEKHLTPRAKAAVAELLEPGETLAEASTWPDEHRRDVKGSGPWHYVERASRPGPI